MTDLKSQKPIISVVIGVYNQKEIIQKVLDGFDQQDFPKNQYEVVVVDSTSKDGTTQLLKSLKYDFHFSHIIQKNKGKAAARNAGVKAAQAEIIVITDADLIPDKMLLQEHYRAHKRHVGPACFQGLEYNMKDLHWPPDEKKITPILPKRYMDGKKLGFYYFLTGNISFQKYLFEQEKGFSEVFSGYGWEDLELGYRFEKRGIPLYYLKKAINYHYHVVTEKEDIKRSFEKGKSAKIFLQKHPKLKTFLGLNPVSVFLHQKIKKKGWFYHWVDANWEKTNVKSFRKIGAWFLKEHAYLSGLRS